MLRILAATDLTDRSFHALGRACRMARATGAKLRILHAPGRQTTAEEDSAARDRIRKLMESFPCSPASIEIDHSIRIPGRDAGEAILEEAKRFKPDLIILGAHGEVRFRDAIFGTTSSHVVRGAEQPVLIVQGDHSLPYAKVMAAIDTAAAEPVLRLALSIASARDLFVVHAFGSALQSLFGGGDVLEDVRTEQDVLTLKVREQARSTGAAAASVHIHNIVEEGDVMDVIMKAWMDVRPDLLVMGTHGRSGLSLLLHGSYAQGALLGCPSDILLVRTPNEDAPSS